MSLETAMKVLTQAPAMEPKVEAPAMEKAPEGAVEAPATETKAAPTEAAPTTEEKKEEPISSKFAALAKKERAIVKKQEEIKAREAAKDAEFAKREAEIAAREAKIKESESLWETDVFKALELRGYDYKKLTDLMLAGETVAKKEPVDPATEAKQQVERLRQELAEKEKAKEDEARKAREDAEKKKQEEYETAMNNYRTEVKDFVAKNAETYELINLYETQELIIDTVQGYWETHQKVLSTKEAADLVEKYLEGELEKATKTKKGSSKLAPPKAEPKKEEQPVITKTESKTLTNNMTPTSASFLPAATEAERMKRALAALNGSR